MSRLHVCFCKISGDDSFGHKVRTTFSDLKLFAVDTFSSFFWICLFRYMFFIFFWNWFLFIYSFLITHTYIYSYIHIWFWPFGVDVCHVFTWCRGRRVCWLACGFYVAGVVAWVVVKYMFEKISQFFLELCLCVTASFQKTEQLQQKINNACCTRTNSTVVRTIANFFCFVSCLEKWGFTVPAVETLGVCRFLYARHRGGGSRVCDKRDCARARSGCNQFASDCRTGDIVTSAMPVIKTCVVAGTSAQLKFGGRDSTVYLLSEPCSQ